MKSSIDCYLPQIPGICRPAASNDVGGIPLPSCWGARGSPWNLRCLTIGGPAKPPGLSMRRPMIVERPTRRKADLQIRLPRLCKQGKRKGRRILCMSSNTSTRTLASALSTCTADGWQQPQFLSSQGNRDVVPLCSVLREELAPCRSTRDLGKVAKKLEKVINKGNASHVRAGSRLAYRLQEANRSFCNGGALSPLESCDVTLSAARSEFRKVLKCEVQRREAEISGWVNKDAQELGVILEMKDDDVHRHHLGNSVVPEQHLVIPTHSTNIEVGMDTHRMPLAPDEPSKQDPTNSPKPGGLEEMMQKKADASDKKYELKLKKLYGSLREDSGLHHDDMPTALEKIGIFKPEQSWIDEIFSRLTRYVTLNEDEFLTFVRRYVECQHKAYEQAFHECDADNSGTVEVEEFVNLLQRFGVEPMKHVLEELLTEIDEDGSGALNLQEFERVMEVISIREGFTKSEYDEFTGLFVKFDRDASGEIDLAEIASVIAWLGYAYDADKVHLIVKELDVDGSGLLNLTEFMTCMRHMRDSELKVVRDFIAADSDHNISGGYDELRPLLSTLGYLANKDAVLESASDVGVDLSSSTKFDLSDVWKILVLWRKREGFTSGEIDDISEAFERYNKQGEGEISSLEIGKVLRWLGYTPSFEEQQSLVSRVDVDNSGKLSLREFLKLIRMLQAKESERIADAFRRHDLQQKGFLRKDVASTAFVDVGCIDAQGKTPKLLADDLMNLDTEPRPDEILSRDGEVHPTVRFQPKPEYVSMDVFLRIANEFNKAARRAFRENSGFSSQEIVQMKECFATYDQDSSGDISSKELVLLIEDLFPTMAHDPNVRPKLTKLMSEIDADGNGSLDFPDFLRLIQQLQDLTMQDRLVKEHKACNETGFPPKDVEGFRELFLAGGDGSTGTILTFECLQRMLGAICPLGDTNLRQLIGILRSIVAKSGADSNERPSLDFPDFLRLMKKLLEVDFAGISARFGDQS